MSFPIIRMRRLRRTETLRRMARETHLRRDDLILPLFVVEGSGVREPVASMPGVFRFSVDAAVTAAAVVGLSLRVLPRKAQIVRAARGSPNLRGTTERSAGF